MTEDANWIGVTPSPPQKCDQSPSCAALVHQVGCERPTTRTVAEWECRNGHHLATLLDGTEPDRLTCLRCHKNWKVGAL